MTVAWEKTLDQLKSPHLALDPDIGGMPNVSPKAYQRAAKIVGDVLWFSFLSIIFTSISVGVAARLFF